MMFIDKNWCSAVFACKVICICGWVEIVGEWVNTPIVNAALVTGVCLRKKIVSGRIGATQNSAAAIIKISEWVIVRSDWIRASWHNAYRIYSITIFIDCIPTNIYAACVNIEIVVVAISRNAYYKSVGCARWRAYVYKRNIVSIMISIEIIIWKN